jgi:hypothetical protein
MTPSPIVTTKRNANWEHLDDELELLNVRLLREVRRRVMRSKAGDFDSLKGLVLSDHEIEAILTGTPCQSANEDEELAKRAKEIEARITRKRGGELRTTSQLNQVTALFQLERIEEQCLVLCLAPEIDSSYARVFAYLHDDITRKQPTVELALKVLCDDRQDQIDARAIFAPNSTLLKNRLIHLCETHERSDPFSQSPLKLDERISAFLLQTAQLDQSLNDWVNLSAPEHSAVANVPAELRDRTIRLVESCFSGGEACIRPLIHLYGRKGSGRRSLAAFAAARIGLPLLIADVSCMSATNTAEALWRLGRESLLVPGIVLVEHFDDLVADDRRRELAVLLEALKAFSPLTFLSGTRQWKPTCETQLFLSLECQVPDATHRANAWRRHLLDTSHDLTDEDLVELASKFNFTEGQIGEAVDAALYLACWEAQPPSALTANLLAQACRTVAAPKLGSLARKLEPANAWSDLVLPAEQLAQLHELTTHIKKAQLVFDKWGFAETFAYGKGITALFEGVSGTGKTMAAGILARELGLDLYKIDLSSVVSKYIGETEKNLNQIFVEAQDSGAILFFDEADALFGKRSEVKDAHDRYANIETAFLLQRMEEYSGIVILATNMKQNIDDAFIRRLRFIVQFPFPDDHYRELIWQRVFPREAPLDTRVNFRWLAKQLKVSGGHIKNISLRAAFLAIERDGSIDMDCLITAARREAEKTGKIATLPDFRIPGERAVRLETAEVL